MSKKHLPERTCIGCGSKRPKPALLRFVFLPPGDIRFDAHQRLPGRGCYLCPLAACLQLAVKRRGLDRSYRCSVGRQVYARFEALAQPLVDQSMPESAETAGH